MNHSLVAVSAALLLGFGCSGPGAGDGDEDSADSDAAADDSDLPDGGDGDAADGDGGDGDAGDGDGDGGDGDGDGDAGDGDGIGAAPGSGGSSSEPCARHACGTHKWACYPIPTPAAESGPHPQNYTDLENGVIRDEVTCLLWEKSNPSSVGNWQDNFERCEALSEQAFGGVTDWRLPTRMEMASITDVTLGSTGYPDVFEVTSGYYVTGSFWYKTILTDNDDTEGNETDMVWGYGTNGFTSNAIVRSDSGLVARCVSGNGAGEGAGEYAVEPPEHYTVDGDVVTDNYTGLIWQRGRSPSLMPFSDAAAYCSGLTLNGQGGFRVPALNELASTVDEAKVGGAINETAFPDNPVGCREPQYWFWAREASEVGGEGWGLSYCDGFTGWNVGGDGAWNYFPTANVRCVK